MTYEDRNWHEKTGEGEACFYGSPRPKPKGQGPSVPKMLGSSYSDQICLGLLRQRLTLSAIVLDSLW